MGIRVLRMLSVLGLVAVLLAGSDAIAQRGGGGRGGPGGFRGFGGFGGGADPVSFLQREDVKKEINLTNSQQEKIEALASDGDRGGFDFERIRELSNEERQEAFARMREQREEQQEEQRKQVYTILNADQAERLKQLEFQFALQQGRLESALAIADVDVEEGGRGELRDAQREAMEKVREQMARIQLEANAAALAKVLDAQKVEQLMGKPFTFEQEAPRFGGGRGGFGRGRGGGDNARPERPRRPGGGGEDNNNSNPRRNR